MGTDRAHRQRVVISPIRGVVESTAALYGDLQGIAGRSLVEIDGLGLPLLDAPARDAAE
jgi:hypothetical protein